MAGISAAPTRRAIHLRKVGRGGSRFGACRDPCRAKPLIKGTANQEINTANKSKPKQSKTGQNTQNYPTNTTHIHRTTQKIQRPMQISCQYQMPANGETAMGTRGLVCPSPTSTGTRPRSESSPCSDSLEIAHRMFAFRLAPAKFAARGT